MAVITEQEWRDLEGVIKKHFNKKMEQMPDYRAAVYNMQTSNRSSEEHLGYGAIGMMTDWTGQVDYSDMTKGYKTTYRHGKVSKGIKVDAELLLFENYSQIKKMVDQGLVNAAYYRKQVDGASTFNNAFNDTYAGADGVGLCSTAHPYSPTNASTQSNEGTYSLTVANIDNTRQKMINFEDDKGNILVRNPNCIIVGPKQWKAAKKIIGSQKEPENANNGINVFGSGELKLIYNPFITIDAWFLADEMVMKDMLHFFTARDTSVEMEKDFNTEQAKYKTVGLWSYGWDDYSFIYGNKVS